MKKNKGLIIGVILFIIAAAVAAWYFFFRTPTAAKIGTNEIIIPPPGPTGMAGPLDQYVCGPGTSGIYPNCVADVINQDTIFSNAIIAAKQKVANLIPPLTSIQLSNSLYIIDTYVIKDKDKILADAANGKDIVQLILIDAENIYPTIYVGSTIRLSDAARATRGRG